jgi:hypothetical protein
MRRPLMLPILFALLVSTLAAGAVTGRVVKVLPHFLDLHGRHTLSPSLFERDAYQAKLRRHPELRSGLRFDVNWKTKGAPAAQLKLRVELRGVAEGNFPRHLTLEQAVVHKHWLGQWSSIALTGDDYRKFGELTAWRVTLWDGDQLLSEQKSFLW